jgi:hypothetical protein
MAPATSLGAAATLGGSSGGCRVLGHDALPDGVRRAGAWATRLDPVREIHAREMRAARSRRDASMLSVIPGRGNR